MSHVLGKNEVVSASLTNGSTIKPKGFLTNHLVDRPQEGFGEERGRIRN